MSSIAGPILGGLRAATATFRRRLLLALALSLIVAIPTYAAIISNQTDHIVTVQDVTITSTPSNDSPQPSGSTEVGTVTVSTPQPFTGFLTLSITNTTLGASGINPLSFVVTIQSTTITNLPTGTTTAVYLGGAMLIQNLTVINYTVKFISHTENAINGISTDTTYKIAQVVSQS